MLSSVGLTVIERLSFSLPGLSGLSAYATIPRQPGKGCTLHTAGLICHDGLQVLLATKSPHNVHYMSAVLLEAFGVQFAALCYRPIGLWHLQYA